MQAMTAGTAALAETAEIC